MHSWCIQAEWDAPTIVGGAGARFWDDTGNEYLDMSSLGRMHEPGHQHPAVIRAIVAQAESLCFMSAAWGAAPRATLAELLLERGGFDGGRVFFTLGGADANEHAVKFARQASGRPGGKIVTRDRSYHGASYATMALSGDSRTGAREDADAVGVLRVPPPYAYRCPYGTREPMDCARRNVEEIGAVIDAAGPHGVAAVLMEPNAGTNGIIAPRNHWPLLCEATRRRGVYLIADEVMSGFGRCGEWFAWAAAWRSGQTRSHDSRGRGLTGAHVPLGAVVVRRAHRPRAWNIRCCRPVLPIAVHPLACAAGVAAVKAYADEHLIERSRHLGREMFQALEALATRHAVIGDVRWSGGLFAIVELVRDRHTREPLRPWPEVHPALKLFVARGRERGVSFAIRGNLIILAPPLIVREEDLGYALDTMDCLLDELDWL